MDGIAGGRVELGGSLSDIRIRRRLPVYLPNYQAIKPVTFTDVCDAVTEYGLACYLDKTQEGWMTDDSAPSLAYRKFAECLRSLLDQKEKR